MKKTLKKAILTLAAVAISATMAVSAFAAMTVTPVYTEATETEKATLTLTIEGATADKQVTVLVLKPDADDTNVVAEGIAYINQDAAGADGKIEYKMTLDSALANGTYKVKVGGEDVSADGIVVADLTVGGGETPSGDYTIGDVNGDEEINAKDALDILKFGAEIIDQFTNATTKEKIPDLVGDVTNDEEINAKDALDVLKFGAEIIDDFARKSL